MSPQWLQKSAWEFGFLFNMDPKCCKIEWIGWLNRVHTISLWDWYALELWSVVIGAALRHFVRIEPVVRQLQIYIYIYQPEFSRSTSRRYFGRVDFRGVYPRSRPQRHQSHQSQGRKRLPTRPKDPVLFLIKKGSQFISQKGHLFSRVRVLQERKLRKLRRLRWQIPRSVRFSGPGWFQRG